MTRPPVFFIANDADHEPTLWQANRDNVNQPFAVVRRCDLAYPVRREAWAFIEAACYRIPEAAS
jgi:hypothetical protein